MWSPISQSNGDGLHALAQLNSETIISTKGLYLGKDPIKVTSWLLHFLQVEKLEPYVD